MKHQELIKEMFEIREAIADIESRELKQLKARKKELEGELIEALDEIGVDKTSVKGIGTVGVSETQIGQIKDYEALRKHIVDTGDLHLLNRAVNNASYRAAIEMYGEIPGMETYTKRALSVRKSA